LSLWGGPLPAFQSKQDSNYLENTCIDFLKIVLGQYGFDQYNKVPRAQLPITSCADRFRRASTELPALVKAINDYLKKQPDCDESKGKKCEAVQLRPNWIKEARKAVLDFDSISVAPFNLIGLTLAGNQHNYSYVTTQASSNVVKQNTEGYGAGLSYMRVTPFVSYILGYSYEKPYKGGNGDEVCKPIGTSTSTTCSSATVGAPTRSTANIISAEVRAVIGGQVAVGPRVEYDASGHNLGLKLPVYLRTTTSKSFTGGLEVGWTRDAHFQGALVLQKAFSFFD
jgi:hypothetical protein